MLYSRLWLNILLPYLRQHPYNDKYARLAEQNAQSIRYGWRIGVENPHQLPLNKRSYDPNAHGTDGKVAITEAFITDLDNGRNIPWLGDIEGEMPTFVDPKVTCPITGETLVWRVIRDGSCGSDTNPSINSLTPDRYATISLINKGTIIKYMYIMYLLYGPSFYMAKTDLAAAFRQFWLAETEPAKITYNFEGRCIADMANIWGSRSGSKICNDMTQCVSRIYALSVNGEHLLHDVNKAIEEVDVRYFEQKLQMHRDVPTLQQQCREQEGAFDVTQIWHWSATSVRAWMTHENMFALQAVLQVQNGVHLIRHHEHYVLARHGQAVVDTLKESAFFTKLIRLKIHSKQFLTTIANCYVDDFIFFYPPCNDHAKRLFRAFSKMLNKSGLDEKESKREDPALQMDLIGIDADSETVTVACTAKQRQRIMQTMYRFLFQDGYSVTDHDSLLGQMAYVAETVWPCKAFLRRIRQQNTRIIQQFGRRTPTFVPMPAWERKDFLWWITMMIRVTRVSVLHVMDPALPEKEMFFDGATNGARPRWSPRIGVWYQGAWLSKKVPAKYLDTFRLNGSLDDKEYAIAHFEMLAITAGLHTLRGEIGRRVKIMLRTDSKQVEAAIKTKSSNDDFLMAGVRWIIMFAIERQLRIYVDYVHTKANVFADAASRTEHIMAKVRPQAQRLCEERGWTLREQYTEIQFPDLTRW